MCTCDATKVPRVGLGVMVFRDGKVLIGKRKNSHGAGEWAWPGGHLEYMESLEACAKREVMEEVGIEIKNIRFLRLLNLKVYAPKHYVDLAFIADWASGEPRVCEPDKYESWEWRAVDDLPNPLFAGENESVEAFKTGKNYFDN